MVFPDCSSSWLSRAVRTRPHLHACLLRTRSVGCGEARTAQQAPCTWCSGEQQAQLMALVAAAGGLKQSRDTPPPMVPTPPIPSQTPPVPAGTPVPGPSSAAVSAQALAVNAAALAAAAAGQNGFPPVHANGGVLGSIEYQAAYQASSCGLLSIFFALHREAS
jgi:hypothetical protein